MTQTRGALARRVLAEHRAWIWPLGAAGRPPTLSSLVLAVAADVAVGARRPRCGPAWRAPRPARPRPSSRRSTATRDGRDAATRELARVLSRRAARRRLGGAAAAAAARWRSSPAPTTSRSPAASPRPSRSATARWPGCGSAPSSSGRYDDIREFLYALETADDFVIVDSIVLAEGDEPSSPLNLTLNVSTYYKAGPDVR